MITNRKIIVVVTLFCLLWGALILYDINSYSSNLYHSYGKQQQEITKQIILTAQKISREADVSLQKSLLDLINDNYQTSAGNYCFVAINGDLYFVKDELYTKKITGDEKVPLAKYLNTNADTIIKRETAAGNTATYSLEDDKNYLISMTQIEEGEDNYTFGIVSSEKFIYQQLDTNLLKIHSLFYLCVSACLFVSIAFLLTRKLKQKEKQISSLESESANNRQVIDRLNDDISKVSNINKNNPQYGFLSKETVEDIINSLTLEQLNASINIKVEVDSLDTELIANVAALLCKLHIEKSISCMWEEREFRIILLNASNQEARQFLQLFHQRYRIYFNEMPEEIRINTEDIEERQVIYGV